MRLGDGCDIEKDEKGRNCKSGFLAKLAKVAKKNSEKYLELPGSFP